MTDEEFFKTFDFCCDWIKSSITQEEVSDPQKSIVYCKNIRSCFIESHDNSKSTAIDYCPFCGKRLSEALDVEMYDVI